MDIIDENKQKGCVSWMIQVVNCIGYFQNWIE